MNIKYKALVSEEIEGRFVRSVKQLETKDLPEGEVLINVKYSALNYKDGLSARGHKGITRKYPHTPGVDASGIVVESSVDHFQVGDKVLVTGYDLGMNTSGGFGEYIRVPAGWVVPLPHNLSLEESMILGTAGFTVAIAINEMMNRSNTPDKGPVLVTGSTGGVGSIAVAILAKIGYSVTASTGKADKYDYLRSIGATEVIDRSTLQDISNKPLLEKKWNAVLDNVGGATLNYALKTTNFWGTVACIGLVDSDRLESTVYPFLLRGIGLIGIDSADRPMDLRLKLWQKLNNEWKPDNLGLIARKITLTELNDEIDIILRGGQTGRVIIQHSDENH